METKTEFDIFVGCLGSGRHGDDYDYNSVRNLVILLANDNGAVARIWDIKTMT